MIGVDWLLAEAKAKRKTRLQRQGMQVADFKCSVRTSACCEVDACPQARPSAKCAA